MMKPTSQDYKEALAKLLSDANNVLDNIYDSMREELENETLGEKSKREEIKQETNDLYNLLNFEVCTRIIKNKLPWRVKLFNRIECHGFGLKSSEKIMIYFTLNRDYHNGFECLLTTEEIRRFMK